MPAPATGPARLARAFVVATSTLCLALGAHVLGGGQVPRTIVLVPLAAVVLAAALPFAGRRIGAPAAVAVLGVGQLGLHQAFGAHMSCWRKLPESKVGNPAAWNHTDEPSSRNQTPPLLR